MDLLLVLHALLTTGSVTSAARSLKLSQPAVSQNLKTLRVIFNDELLVAVGRSLQPTELALSLAEPLRRLLADAEHLLSPRAAFDPLSEELRVVISTADYVGSLLAPRLVDSCARMAPKVSFEFIPAIDTVTLEELSSVDFLIAPRRYGDGFGKRIRSLSLWHDRMVFIGSRVNASLADAVRPKDVRRYRQVGYRINPRAPERIRRWINPIGMAWPTQVCSAPSFSVLVDIVERSDCVALVPRLLAQEMKRYRKIKIAEFIQRDAKFEIGAFWSPSVSDKRGHTWAQRLLQRVAAETVKEYE